MRAVVGATVEECGLPGAVVAFSRGGGALSYVVVGTDANGTPMAEDGLFPVASVTKLATALCGATRLSNASSREPRRSARAEL